MKILQIFGAVVAVHVLAFIFIFASPGCNSSSRSIPTPDATAPSAQAADPVTFNTPMPMTPVSDYNASASNVAYNPASPSGYATPTRPGSPNAAAVTPPKPAPEVAPVSTYTVARGDSLWSIAKKNNMTVAELAKSNNLSVGATLQPGRKLIVPGKASVPQDLATTPAADTPATVEKAPARASGEVIKHTVVAGESLGVIAKKYGVTVSELSRENTITDPSKVRAGQQLTIPASRRNGNSAARSTTTAAPASSTTSTTTPATTAAQTPAAPASTPAQPGPSSSNVPHFEIAPPPPGQDLDAGLKETSVQTIQVEVPTAQPAKK